MLKHNLSRIYCEKETVKQEFMYRMNNELFSEEEDRDNLEFWEKQKEDYLEIKPTHARMFTETNKD